MPNRIPTCVAQTWSKIEMALSFYKNNPLCGINLERGAKFIAMAQMIFAAVIVLTATIVMILKSNIPPATNGTEIPELLEFEHQEHKDIISQALIVWISCAVDFCIYAFLYKGIRESNYVVVNRCWKMIFVILFAEMVQSFFLYISRGSHVAQELQLAIFATNLYTLWVMFVYKTQLKRGADFTRGHVPANPAEEFERIA